MRPVRPLRSALAGLVLATSAIALGATPAAAAPAVPATAAPATVAAASVAPAAQKPGTYVPVRPFRAYDTRKTRAGALAAGRALTVQLGGRGSVPRTNVLAVAVTLTAVSPTWTGGLTAYGYGRARPAITNLLYQRGLTTTVATISRVSSSSALTIYNAARRGRTQVTVDVSGYYLAGALSTVEPGVLHPLVTATRVLDTRQTHHTLAARHATTVTLGGKARVPRAGVGAVVVTLSVVSPQRSGGLIAYSAGNDRPVPFTNQFVGGQNRAAFAVVPTNDAGAITIYNASAGTVQVVIDLLGWTNAGPAAAAGALQTRFPGRVYKDVAIPARQSRVAAVAGLAGVPQTHVAAVLANITVGSPTRGGTLLAWAGGAPPSTGTVSFAPKQTGANLTLIPVSSSGTISLRNYSAGSVRIYLDVVGFVPSTTVTPPTTSTSRYIRSSTEMLLPSGKPGRFADPSSAGEGCIDATASSSLVLIQFGAQLDDTTGVQLTVSGDEVSYVALVKAIDGYLASFAACSPPSNPVIALGTNNDGHFDKYTAANRGTDWANKVLNSVRIPNGSEIAVVGANDIEQLFRGTWDDGIAWEKAYLAATQSDLVFNGSADGCPYKFGAAETQCAYWTVKQIYELAAYSGRVTALPQIYSPTMATQWANIDRSGGAGIVFAGALTEAAVCAGAQATGCSDPNYTPQQGWTALYRAISTVVASPNIPAVTDLRADS